MNLVQIESELNRIRTERAEESKKHHDYVDRTAQEINELLRQKEMAMNGLDLSKIQTAESILDVDGLKYGEYNERCINEAIKDIATGQESMRREYFGVKNYAHWQHQECDCKYGYGPTHGSIVFSVGYKRNRLCDEFSEYEKDSCIYYLNLLKNSETRKAIIPKSVSIS